MTAWVVTKTEKPADVLKRIDRPIPAPLSGTISKEDTQEVGRI